MENKNTITCGVVMLPTNKKSNLYKMHDKPLYEKYPVESVNAGNQFLYLISERGIREGDWFIMNGCILRQCKQINKNLTASIQDTEGGQHYKDVCKKIEATTDSSLYSIKKENIGIAVLNLCDKFIPQIHQSFIEHFVKANGNISEVEIEVEEYTETTYSSGIDISYPEIRIKTHSDNTVIIHNCKKITLPNRTYSVDELKMIASEFAQFKIKQYLIFRNNDSDWCERTFDEWFEQRKS